jgi:hypothetical protein
MNFAAATEASASVPEPVEPHPLASEESLAVPSPKVVGVRHDLRLAPAETRQARCTCLAVEVATASSAVFRWSDGQPPEGAGLAVAISGQGVPCEGHDGSVGRPSIAGVEQEGKDLVVEIEELPRGVPLASGVLLPEVPRGGHVFVRSRGKKLPYARPGRCKLR